MIATFTSSVLAAPNAELIKLLIVGLIMIGAPLVKKLSERREQIERAKMAKRPLPPAPPKPRDSRFRNEIEAFLDEVGRRRTGRSLRPDGSRSEAPTKSAPGRMEPETTAKIGLPSARPTPRPEPAKPAVQRPAAVAAGKTPDASKSPGALGLRQRPGSEIAARKAPVSEDLGTQIRAHLAQYLDGSRMSQRVRSDLGNAIEQVVQEHLGLPTSVAKAAKPPATAGASPIVSLLRNPAGLRAAIVVNEILGPPKGLNRKI